MLIDNLLILIKRYLNAKFERINSNSAIKIELPLELRQKLKVQSALDGINMRDAVINLIEDYVEKKSKKS